MGRKVCLVIPPSLFLADERVFVSLGILKVAAVLERAGHQVEMLDLSGVHNYLDVVRLHFSGAKAEFVGITCTTPQFPYARQVVSAIREVNDTIRVCLGGPHITATCASYKRFGQEKSRSARDFQELLSLADVFVSGDGEEAIFRALEDTTAKWIDADDPETALFLKEQNLHTYPFPARHLVDLQSYQYAIGGEPATSLICQLGCPYGCSFCGMRLSPSFRQVRIRNSASVIEELRQIYKTYGFRGFFFLDDELNVSKNFLYDLRGIADLQDELGVDFRLRGFIKSNLFNETQAAMMVKVGFKQTLIGFESGDERILTNIKKKATLAQNTRCMEIAHKYGLKVKALMSAGHPGERPETIEATRDWLIDVKPADFDITAITVYASTPYFDFAKPIGNGVWAYTADSGDRLYSYEMDFGQDESYYKGIPGEYKSYVFTDHISAEELVKMRDWVEKDVRTKLNIPFYQVTAATKFEASMGQLPGFIFRSSGPE